ncbi:BQ5605_C001g00473 [Microbotryum silenes-dioicae]|uniref:BQ5605_C001g00473 protein n=1 Tax=Microbotryum silenes-dioicae TaxID=796604 RepID=A0A2X0M3F6_9BASI|nr:BQ5605_C001g00473 [Microbotryum silenes-dioicae]
MKPRSGHQKLGSRRSHSSQVVLWREHAEPSNTRLHPFSAAELGSQLGARSGVPQNHVLLTHLVRQRPTNFPRLSTQGVVRIGSDTTTLPSSRLSPLESAVGDQERRAPGQSWTCLRKCETWDLRIGQTRLVCAGGPDSAGFFARPCHGKFAPQPKPSHLLYIHHSYIFTIHTYSPFIHIHHSYIFTIHTYSPFIHIHHSYIFTIHTHQQRSSAQTSSSRRLLVVLLAVADTRTLDERPSARDESETSRACDASSRLAS